MKQVIINTFEDFANYFDFFEVTEKEFVPGIRPKGYYIQSLKQEVEEITIPESIGEKPIARINGFGQHPELKQLTIPEAVDFDSSAFDDCPALIRDDGNLVVGGRLLKTNTDTDVLRIPEDVTQICEELVETGPFSPNTTIKAIYFNEGLKKIGGSAFANCQNLETVIFPESLEEIEYNAFESCESLEKVTFPEGLKKIGGYAFLDCKKLKEISISPGTECEDGAFKGCPPDSNGLLIVNGTLFSGDSRPKSGVVEIPSSVRTIGSYAFFDPGTIIDEVIITDSVEDISDTAFGISAIERFVVMNSDTQKIIFETDQFAECDGLDFSEEFFEMCELICNKLYDDLEDFGTVYVENITE